MQDKNVIYASAIISIVLVLIYYINLRRRGLTLRDSEPESIVALILYSGGVVGGLLLFFSEIWDGIKLYFNISSLHIMAGGVAIFALSIKGIASKLHD